MLINYPHFATALFYPRSTSFFNPELFFWEVGGGWNTRRRRWRMALRSIVTVKVFSFFFFFFLGGAGEGKVWEGENFYDDGGGNFRF